MRNKKASSVALGGVLAAVAVVIMCLGGLIPLATYICPMLCAIIAFLVLQYCGRKTAWVWYAVVAILCLLLGPDKEAAAVFLMLGYYPIIKPIFEHSRLHWLWKLLLFNGSVILLYRLLLGLFGMTDIASDFAVLGTIGLVIMLLLGNAVFFMLDFLLTMLQRKLQKRD